MQHSKCVCAVLAACLSLAAGCSGGTAHPNDHTPPSVTITGITEGQRITTDRGVSVVASDSESTVYEVALAIDGNVVFDKYYNASSVTEGYTVPGGVLDAGNHTLSAAATDYAGNAKTYVVHYTVSP
jgi:hypothetical protein